MVDLFWVYPFLFWCVIYLYFSCVFHVFSCFSCFFMFFFIFFHIYSYFSCFFFIFFFFLIERKQNLEQIYWLKTYYMYIFGFSCFEISYLQNRKIQNVISNTSTSQNIDPIFCFNPKRFVYYVFQNTLFVYSSSV